MQIPDIPGLKNDLQKRLGNMYSSKLFCLAPLNVARYRSDTDPGALADYIIALLKHEKPPTELKSFCISQLSDFLHDKTEGFVESLFRRIEGGPEEEQATPVPVPVQPIPHNNHSNHGQNRQQQRHHHPSQSYSDEEEGVASEATDRHFRHHRGWERERNRSRSPSGRGGERPFAPRGHHEGMQDRRPYRRYEQQGPYLRGGARGGMMGGSFHDNRLAHGRRGFGNAPPQVRSDTRLVIDRIPPEFCTVAQVNEYFQRFGNIVNISLQPEQQRAALEYATKEEANAAYTSPDVIFGNRFVKVYWDQDPAAPTTVPPYHRRYSGASASSHQPNIMPGMVSASEVARPASFKAEAYQKKQEALKGMMELQRQKQELLTKYINQQKELLEKLENKSVPEMERQELLKTLRNIDEIIKLTQSSSSSGVNKSSESTEMAVDSESSKPAPTPSPAQPHTPILKGGPVQRGRGAVLASQAAHRLDLRPTTLLMTPVPSRVGSDVSSIRKLFEPYGEVKNVSIVNGDASIAFARRPDAEKALFYLPKTDLGEPFGLEWSNGPPATTNSPPPQASATFAEHSTPQIDLQLDSNNSMMDDVITLDSSPHGN